MPKLGSDRRIDPMKIAVIGPGAIGSTFAWRLSNAGHDVTVIARGARLAWLQRERAIVTDAGERANVDVAGALDETTAWDLVLVTVLAPQVGAVLDSLRRSAAKRVMFMFNTFDPIEPLRDAVGSQRFSFGFPMGVFTLLVDGKIYPRVRPGTTATDAHLARVFTEAGVPTVVEHDMHSWLRSHAALVVPLMSIGVTVHGRKRGITWPEATAQARAFAAGFAIVRALGHPILPSSMAVFARLPTVAVAALLWALSRTKMLRDLGALGSAEPRMLIDMMAASAPHLASPLLAVRP
jgi:2-dehydropantoate 2-reductase